MLHRPANHPDGPGESDDPADVNVHDSTRCKNAGLTEDGDGFDRLLEDVLAAVPLAENHATISSPVELIVGGEFPSTAKLPMYKAPIPRATMSRACDDFMVFLFLEPPTPPASYSG